MSSVSSAPDQADDAALVRRARLGDRAAANDLVHRHLPRAFSVAYSILGNHEDSEDVVQDAFVAALNALDRFDPARPFEPWLYRIVANRALTGRKRRQRRQTEELHEESAGSSLDNPADDAERLELRERLNTAVGALPEQQRRIVQLADVDGLTSSEIGEMLEMPAGTVRFHLHSARRALRRTLADLAPAEESE